MTKSCGSCTLCCKVLGVAALSKPVNKWCPHVTRIACRGCGIYPTRPDECKVFQCLWLASGKMPEELKPSNCHFVLVGASDVGHVGILCDPGYPDAWRHPKIIDHIRNISTGFLCVATNGRRHYAIKDKRYREVRANEITYEPAMGKFTYHIANDFIPGWDLL